MQIESLISRLKLLLGAMVPAPRTQHAPELCGMTDRELTDLGIGRSEIPAVMASSRSHETGTLVYCPVDVCAN
jgi:hypothetical protein